LIVIRAPSELITVGDADLRSYIEQRFQDFFDEVGYFDPDLCGYFVVIEHGDDIEAIEKEAGCPIAVYEVLEEHQGFYQIVFIPSDGDYGISVYVPKGGIADPALTSFCEAHAVPAP
jgi:hypothetical protein